MPKQMILALHLAAVLAVPLAPTASLAYTSGVEHVGEDGASFLASPFTAAFDPAPQVPRPPMHPQGGDNATAFLASPFAAAFDPTPRMARPPVYGYPVQPPPGQCRWERQILDRYGRPVLDQHGQPLREYTVGPCWRPPY